MSQVVLYQPPLNFTDDLCVDSFQQNFDSVWSQLMSLPTTLQTLYHYYSTECPSLLQFASNLIPVDSCCQHLEYIKSFFTETLQIGNLEEKVNSLISLCYSVQAITKDQVESFGQCLYQCLDYCKEEFGMDSNDILYLSMALTLVLPLILILIKKLLTVPEPIIVVPPSESVPELIVDVPPESIVVDPSSKPNIDYYAVLGIGVETQSLEKLATIAEIKKAYRKALLISHPDKNPNALETFRLLSEAYSVLIDEQKRKTYDDQYVRKKVENKEKDNDPLLIHESPETIPISSNENMPIQALNDPLPNNSMEILESTLNEFLNDGSSKKRSRTSNYLKDEVLKKPKVEVYIEIIEID